MEESSTRMDYMELYVGRLKMMGLWPRRDMNQIRYWFMFFLILFTVGAFAITMYAHIYKHSGDIDGVAKVFDFATVYTSSLFRFAHAFFYCEKSKALTLYVRDNFIHESFNRRGDKITMDKHSRMCKLISTGYTVFTMLWLVHMSVTPVVHYYILKSKKNENGTSVYPDLEFRLAIDVDMPFDSSQPVLLYFSYVVSIISYYLSALVYCVMDSFWFACLILTTGQFQLISHSIRSLSDDDDDEEMERVLNLSLRQHIRIRRFVELIEDVTNACILVDFLHAVSSISFILFDMTIAIYKDSFIKIMDLIGYLMVSVGHMWVLDYFGNEMTLKEEEISMAIYEIPWHRNPIKWQSHVLIIMRLGRNPLKLTGGKLYRVSLDFFAATMRNIFSYFTVLLQLRESTDLPKMEETLSVT